jgi:hypothetical protein
LGGEVRRSQVFLWYNYQNDITYEKEDIIFATEPELFVLVSLILASPNQKLFFLALFFGPNQFIFLFKIGAM